MGRLLIIIGGVLIVAGSIWLFGERFGLGRLPGDLSFQRDNVRVHFPIVTSIIISVILSAILWAINYFRR